MEQITIKCDSPQVSDGYHTFEELYEHRVTLFMALCRQLAKETTVWRTWLHSDGSNFDGWFVLGIGLDAGEQITYHLPAARWDETSFAVTRDRGPEFDGHSSADVLERIKRL